MCKLENKRVFYLPFQILVDNSFGNTQKLEKGFCKTSCNEEVTVLFQDYMDVAV
jgi:hypothetical protein